VIGGFLVRGEGYERCGQSTVPTALIGAAMTDERSTRQPLGALPAPRGCPFSMRAAYAEMREQAPVLRVALPGGLTGWAVTRHAEVRAMLADPRFSSDFTHPNFPELVPAEKEMTEGQRPSLVAMDPPEHTQARRSLVGEFTVRRMNALRPRIQQIVDERIDAILAGPRPCDLFEKLALPVPSLVICEQLGVPYEDHGFFQSRTQAMGQVRLPVEERMEAIGGLMAYIGELISEKARNPTEDDLLGRQVLKQRETGYGDHEDLVAHTFLLLAAGHETTANQITIGTLAILQQPELREKLTTGGAEAVQEVVEELLRYFTIIEYVTTRIAKEDVELGGVTIRAGEPAVALIHSANQDPRVFPRPGELDAERGGRHHVAFGYGAHQCIGQNLARLELQITYETLFRRIPGLRLAVPYEELSFKDGDTVYGVHELPVTW
jgi:cytochrome P450